MNLFTILKAVQALGPVLANVDAVRDLVEHATKALSADDQAALKRELGAIRAQNDEAHDRLQEKLDAAAKR